MLKRFLILVIALNLFACVSFKEEVKHNNALSHSEKSKYVFLFIGDGMGPNQRHVGEKAFGGKLWMNTLPVNAMVSTSPYGGGITDSAASATAFACGKKTKNKYLGVDHKGKSIESVATMAKKLGWKIGIVSSVPLNHATPAAFYAHRSSRSMYNEIIQDLAVSNFDYFGGNSLIINSKNKKQILKCLKDNNYITIKSTKELPKLDSDKKYIVHNWIPNVIDHNNKGLSLADYTRLGIKHLYNNDSNFFIMVEGGKIDWTSHSNDGGSMVHEVKDFDNAIKVALDFYKKHPKSTTIIVTSDHETGGLQLNNIKHEKLLQQKCSYGTMNYKLKKYKKEKLPYKKVLLLMQEDFGIKKLSTEELSKLHSAWIPKKVKKKHDKYSALLRCMKKIFNERCGLKWTRGGHSAADIPLNAIGVGSELFAGYYENNQIAHKLKNLIKAVAKK